MEELYYNLEHPSAFTGVRKLYQASKKMAGVEPRPTIKRVKEWLDKQRVYSMHYPRRKRFKRAKTITWGIDFLFEVLEICKNAYMFIYL